MITNAKDQDPRTRRDASLVLAALCENESDHPLVLQGGGLKAIAGAVASKDEETAAAGLRSLKLMCFNSQVQKACKDGSLGIMQELRRCAESQDTEVSALAKDVQATLAMC